MNKVELIGRLTKDVELKATSNEVAFCNFTLAVDRRFKDASGQRQTDFINCTAWRQTATFIAGHFKKGDRVAICGSIQTRTYDDNGTKRMAVEVIADEAEFVDSNNSPKAEARTESEPKEDSGELPFEI